MAETVATYEAAQNFSGLTAWLHGFRFRQIVRTARALAQPGAPLRVLEIGCAYGKAYAALDAALSIDYVGVDAHSGFIAEGRQLYASRPNFRAHEANAEAFLAQESAALGPIDLIFALETLEHMPAQNVVQLLEAVAAQQPRLFVASVPVEVGPSILLKNFGSALVGYSRHREYTFAETLWASAYRLDKLPPHACGHKGFDWRWLARSVDKVMPVRRIRRFPFDALPSLVATSVYIEAAPR